MTEVPLQAQIEALQRRVVELEAAHDLNATNWGKIEKRFAEIQTSLRAAGTP